MTIGDLWGQSGKPHTAIADVLSSMISATPYRLLIIDTLSRIVSGGQNDASVMTQRLSPLQELAHQYDAGVLLIDHHGKQGSIEPNLVSDILGSMAKGAMADTIIGLYRTRGASRAKLRVLGREVEETELDLKFDPQTGSWELAEGNLPPQQMKIYRHVQENFPITNQEIADTLEINKGTVNNQLDALSKKGLVYQDEEKRWLLPDHATDATDATYTDV